MSFFLLLHAVKWFVSGFGTVTWNQIDNYEKPEFESISLLYDIYQKSNQHTFYPKTRSSVRYSFGAEIRFVIVKSRCDRICSVLVTSRAYLGGTERKPQSNLIVSARLMT